MVAIVVAVLGAIVVAVTAAGEFLLQGSSRRAAMAATRVMTAVWPATGIVVISTIVAPVGQRRRWRCVPVLVRDEPEAHEVT